MHVLVRQITRNGQTESRPVALPSLSPGTYTLKSFLTAVIEVYVAQYNQGTLDKLPDFIEITDAAAAKGSFRLPFIGRWHKVDVQEAIENGLYAFKDGLFVVFVNKYKFTELTETVELHDNDEVMFIKLAFMAAGYGVSNFL